MKIFSFLIILFNLTCLYAQKDVRIYNPSEIFNYSFNRIEVSDSIHYEILSYSAIRSPYNPLSKFQKKYSEHTKYGLENGQIISLDIYNDTTILFSEFVKTKNPDWDSLITSGELKIDRKNYELKEFNLPNQYGEDSIVTDTVFQLMQVGFWSNHLDLQSFEIGNYEEGTKVGDWFVINSEYSLRLPTPYLKKIEYDNGKLKNETFIDISQKKSELEKNISGEWFSVGLTSEQRSYCKQFKCSVVFVRDSSKFNMGYVGVYDYLDLKKNNILKIKTSRSCGVGFDGAREAAIQRKWSLTKDADLILEGRVWKIEYLTENEMIISMK